MNEIMRQHPGEARYRLRLLVVSTVGIFTAEVLVMLLVEGWAGHLPVLARVFLDAALLMVCVFPALYFLVFQELYEQIDLRLRSEQQLAEVNRSLGRQVEERTARLQRANEDLLGEIRERARLGLVLNQSLKEVSADRASLRNVLDALRLPLLVVDAAGLIRLVNAGGAKLLGRQAQELADMPVDELFDQLSAEAFSAFVAAGESGSELAGHWRRSLNEAARPVKMVLEGDCLWYDETAAVLSLKGGSR